MKPTKEEEVWFARVVMIFGAKEMVDLALNLFTLIKEHSGLPIVSPSASSDDRVTIAYIATNILVGLYFVSGGQLMSRIAFGHPVRRDQLVSAMRFPEGAGWLSIGFRATGVYQFIQGVLAVGLAIAFHPDAQPYATFSPRPSVVETAWALEHLLLSFVFVAFGGVAAHFFLGGKIAESGRRQ